MNIEEMEPKDVEHILRILQEKGYIVSLDSLEAEYVDILNSIDPDKVTKQ